MSKPVITVLMAEDEPSMPGLEALGGKRRFTRPGIGRSWKPPFRKRKFCW